MPDTKPSKLYMIALHHEGVGYLLANKQSMGLMVWDTYWGAVQALAKVEPYLGSLNPEILLVDESQHPGIPDYYLNHFILEVADAPNISEIRVKEIAGVGLVYPCKESKLLKYRLVID